MKTFVNSTILAVFLAAIGWALLPASEAETVFVAEPAMGQSDLRMIQNNGQWDERIEYSIPLNGGEVFLEQGRLTYALFHLPDHHGHHDSEGELEDSLVKGHAFHVSFPNANPEALLEPSLKYPEYHNYYLGNDPSTWAGEVPLFGQVTYQEIWPGVDYRVYGFGDALKYDFILAPGTDPATVSLLYEGLSSLSLSNDTLYLETTVRQLTEFPPVAYQVLGGEKVLVPCDYRLDGNMLSYVFPEGYDPSLELIIDPTIVFSTYTGSNSDNWGFAATYDSAGNAYAGGIQFGATSVFGGYPRVGAIQNSYQGGQTDVTISKFSPDGFQLIFSTYLGGNADEEPHSLIVDNNAHLVVMGRTNSGNFPTTSTAFDVTINGNFDFFVSKFNSSGSALIGSSYIGGSGNDGVNISEITTVFGTTKYNHSDGSRGEVVVDIASNIYFTGPTGSGNFPMTHGSNTLGGSQDAVVVCLNSGLNTLLWSRRFGGASTDASYGIRLEPGSGKVFIAGGTTSADLPISTGAYQDTSAGGLTDGFVAKLIPGTDSVEACTYLGTSSYDQVYLIDLDEEGKVYVTGQTNGIWPIVDPVGLGPVYQNVGANQFITKLSNDLTSVEYSTTIGSSNANFPNIIPTAFMVDACGNVHLAGWGGTTNSNIGSPNLGNTSGMVVTSDAFKDSTDGSDFYVMALDQGVQNLTYGSYLGGNNSTNGEHIDGGMSRFDKETGILYLAVCAGCGGNNTFPAQPGNVHSTTNNSANCNMVLVKMAFDSKSIAADFLAKDPQGMVVTTIQSCDPVSIVFDNLSTFCGDSSSIQYAWDFDDNGATSTLFEPQHTFNQAGIYLIRLIASTSNGMIADTNYQMINILNPLQADAGPDQTICAGDTFTLQALNSGTSYLWSPAGSFFTSDTIASPSGIAQDSMMFSLKVTDANGCEAFDTVEVFIAPAPTADFSFYQAQGYYYVFSNLSSSASSHLWDFGDQTTSILPNPTHTYQASGDYEVTLIVTNDCGSDTFQTNLLGVDLEDQISAQQITLYPNPTNGIFVITASDLSVEELSIEVFDMKGRLVLSERANTGSQEDRIRLDLSEESNGIYLVRISYGEKTTYRKVVRH